MYYYRDFGLSRPPFEMVGQPTSLYMSKSHREGLAALEWGLLHEPGSFTLLLGEVGTGKTTLVYTLLSRHYDLARIAYVMDPKLGFEEMLRVILERLGYLPSAVTKLDLLRKFEWVLGELRPRERIAIIVDEAQALSDETLEELRLFSNYGRNSEGHLEILLVGQPELLTRLMAPSLRQFHQRIGARMILNPLKREESFEYIEHKLRDAGGTTTKIFAKHALNEIVDHSKGIPRQLNLLCNNALIRAYAGGLKWVSAAVARAAVNEYENLGRSAEEFHTPLRSKLVRSVSTPLAISTIGLGLVTLAGLYSIGVIQVPRPDVISGGESKSVTNADVVHTVKATINEAPPALLVPDTNKVRNTLGNSLSTAADTKANIRAVGDATPERTSIPRTGLANPSDNGAAKSHEPSSYYVQSGDTIERIAIRHFGPKVNIQSFIEANPQIRDVNRIYPGDTVFLPGESTKADESGSH